MADKRCDDISDHGEGSSPINPPPFLGFMTIHRAPRSIRDAQSCSSAVDSACDMWDRLFLDGYRADTCVYTTDGIIPSHASVLGMASPVMKNMLRQAKSRQGRRRSIYIKGVPHQAVKVFIRFLYSSRYQQEDMNQFILHLLVLSHVFVVPSLKMVCVQHLERGLITIENVVDIFQLSRLCDAPRLGILCRRMILKDFKSVSETEGWKVMKQSDPKLKQELLDCWKRLEERKMYVQLYEAMEALVHICRDGCRTIGPHDKVLKHGADPCDFPACRGLESLVRHFAVCKNRVLGGCTHCKRMWQLLELHSRLCSLQTEEDGCKVPLCNHFKEKVRLQHKKDEVKWRLLVRKVLEAKNLSPGTFL